MRNRIIMAAVEEMNLRGIKFTMSDLARRLSVSKTSLYENFSSKNELIHIILLTAIQDVENQEEAIYTNSELSIDEKIHSILKVWPTVFGPTNNYRIFEELQHNYPEEFQIVDSCRIKQMQRLLSLVKDGIETGEVRPINLNVFRQVIESATNEMFTYRFLSENNMTFLDALSAMADIIVFGVMLKKS